MAEDVTYQVRGQEKTNSFGRGRTPAPVWDPLYLMLCRGRVRCRIQPARKEKHLESGKYGVGVIIGLNNTVPGCRTVCIVVIVLTCSFRLYLKAYSASCDDCILNPDQIPILGVLSDSM